MGLLLRLYKINSPILDLYPTRQEQCAMIARNFFYQGFNIFNPQVDWFGQFDSSWRLELPLISYLASLLYSIFGIHEFLGRIVSIIFSLGSIYLIFQLSKKLFNQRIATYASFLFAVSPFSVYFGRAFMPETAMIFFSVASIYYFSQWVDRNSKFHYILALICTALAFLVKLPSLYLLLPLAYLAYSKYRNKVFLKPLLYVFLFFVILPSLLWYREASINTFTFLVANKSNFAMLIEPDFYRRIFESVNMFVLTPIGAFLALLGFFLSVKNRREYLLYFWLLAIVIYTLLAPEANYAHYYYQLPFVPIFSIFAAKAVDRFTYDGEMWKFTIFSKMNRNLVRWGIMMSILIVGYLSILPCFNWNSTTLRASKAIEVLTEKDAIVIAGRCKQQAPLYYTNRKGWETNEEPVGALSYSWAKNLDKYNFPERSKEGVILSSEINLIEFLKKHGADYYFTTNMQVLKKDPDFSKYLYSNYKVIKEEEGFVIFDLRK